MLNKRVISAIVALPLLFAVVIYDKYIFFGAFFIVTALGLYEYFNAVDRSNIKPIKVVGVIGGLIFFSLMYNDNTLEYVIPYITILIMVLLSIPLFFKRYNLFSSGVTAIGVFYVPLFLSYLYRIRFMENGVYLVWFVFICAWLTDTFAYFSGMLFGKTKLCPSVSPKKTVEGSIGGIVGSTVGCVIYGQVVNSIVSLNIPIIHLIILGILCSTISQIGDLAASSIKRNVGIKDYGNIMPGHGGALDRFDSILFVAPIIYYYMAFVIL